MLALVVSILRLHTHEEVFFSPQYPPISEMGNRDVVGKGDGKNKREDLFRSASAQMEMLHSDLKEGCEQERQLSE